MDFDNDNVEKIIWSIQSRVDMDNIFEHYLKFPSSKPHQHLNNILDAVNEFVFSPL